MEGGEENLMPLANVGRIMRQTLPPNTKISNEAKQCVHQSACEFISMVTGEAASICKQNNGNSISDVDVIKAFNVLGFYNYAEALQTLVQTMAAPKVDTAPSSNHFAGMERQQPFNGRDTAPSSNHFAGIERQQPFNGGDTAPSSNHFAGIERQQPFNGRDTTPSMVEMQQPFNGGDAALFSNHFEGEIGYFTGPFNGENPAPFNNHFAGMERQQPVNGEDTAPFSNHFAGIERQHPFNGGEPAPFSNHFATEVGHFAGRCRIERQEPFPAYIFDPASYVL